ncbi:Uncharacterized protein PECH_008482 [Penicillium ucsense]|uniref:Peroxin 20 n=1 Tax=Penicillium ucsense TaxID=2839758 RepID=A0A8J8VZ20_9EURO|nr:Uncharacterized protein PECM_005177 [Penicillium ucsense]KAF7734091.1 Uncharacterized protein PECH_008482 [Penicillium ucsense]
MGDALCGPSNALQNFQKHASVDRTLQQDRLISRQPENQGFRSQGTRDGLLDTEFAAFENSHGGLAPMADLQHPAHFAHPTQHPAAVQSPPNWASDFQNLHISKPLPHQAHRASPIASSQTGWQNDFLSQQHQQHAVPQHVQAEQSINTPFRPSFGHHMPMYNNSMNMHHSPSQQAPIANSLPTEQFDESAFEAAFEQARADMQELQAPELTQTMETISQDQPLQTEETIIKEQEKITIGSDTIVKDDSSTAKNDADALARTAEHLLNSVRHEKDQKFQQSNFLALMRRIRDREVQVEGDEFREVSSNP